MRRTPSDQYFRRASLPRITPSPPKRRTATGEVKTTSSVKCASSASNVVGVPVPDPLLAECLGFRVIHGAMWPRLHLYLRKDHDPARDRGRGRPLRRRLRRAGPAVERSRRPGHQRPLRHALRHARGRPRGPRQQPHQVRFPAQAEADQAGHRLDIPKYLRLVKGSGVMSARGLRLLKPR